MRPTLIAAGLLVSAVSSAQTLREREERLQDHRVLRQDRREALDDRKDLDQVQKVLADFDDARARRDWSRLDAIDARVKVLLTAELEEGRAKTARDRAELARDGAESRTDRRDDQEDLHRDVKTQDWRRALAVKWKALVGKSDPASLDRKRALLVEFDGLARSELARDRQERREDLHQAHEDRR
jgi:hypothetical protein